MGMFSEGVDAVWMELCLWIYCRCVCSVGIDMLVDCMQV